MPTLEADRGTVSLSYIGAAGGTRSVPGIDDRAVWQFEVAPVERLEQTLREIFTFILPQ